MSIVTILQLMLTVSIILLLFSLSMRARFADLGYMVTHWKLGLGAIIAMFIVVPAVSIILASMFDIDPAVKIALVAIALSPIPPVLPSKQIKAGGHACYVTGLLILATLASIVIAPFGVSLGAYLLDAEASITPMSVAMPLVISILLPLFLGLIAGPVLGRHVDIVSSIGSKLGSLLLVVAMLGLVIVLMPAIIHLIGQGTLAVLTAAIIAGLAAGYMLGGKDPGDRTALALAAASRHPGVAVAIATHSFPDAKLAPAAIVMSMVISTLISLPLLHLLTKQGGASQG
ncbi:bile acid:sodium symporter [Novosphingobium guangzhouense]|uniref:Na+-dependent transporter n=1 Tax=Novosphingobium guangzhouense TaxID=1850347 RepID=A0A2K2FZ23_9SPHN|nr:bile acid:sodium symporter [Novosphingobium guangzhouense]PNU04020.1 hypothetical protein A8V01_05235 [Novosphingobium guangzhouense]